MGMATWVGLFSPNQNLSLSAGVVGTDYVMDLPRWGKNGQSKIKETPTIKNKGKSNSTVALGVKKEEEGGGFED